MTRHELINDISNNLLTYDINYNQAKADKLNKKLKQLDNQIKYIERQKRKIPFLNYFTWRNHYISVIVKTLLFILILALGILNFKVIITFIILIIGTTSLESNILDIIDNENYELEELLKEYNKTKEEYDNAAMQVYQLTKKQNKYREEKECKTAQPHVSTPTNPKAKSLQLNNKKVYR